MKGTHEKDETEKPAEGSAEQSRFADASAKLFANQAALMTAMTAFSINLGSQMAGAFFGAFSAAAEKEIKPAEPPQEERAKVVPLRVVPKAKKVPDAAEIIHSPPDDLKAISGIGPRLVKVLNGKGIFRFSDIASWTDADIDAIDTELGLDGRIVRDDWVGQARNLLKEGR
jgi:NADH-quinone oxidoreductase subunit E